MIVGIIPEAAMGFRWRPILSSGLSHRGILP